MHELWSTVTRRRPAINIWLYTSEVYDQVSFNFRARSRSLPLQSLVIDHASIRFRRRWYQRILENVRVSRSFKHIHGRIRFSQSLQGTTFIPDRDLTLHTSCTCQYVAARDIFVAMTQWPGGRFSFAIFIFEHHVSVSLVSFATWCRWEIQIENLTK